MLRSLTDEDIDKIAERVSNWGRWGYADQVGTLNLISDSDRARAALLVRTGRLASLARPLNLGPDHDGVRAPVHTTWRTTLTPAETAADFIGLAFHGPTVTHVDALNHVHRDGVMFNGHDATIFDPIGGYPVLAVDRIASRMCGRGVLLDFPAADIEPDLVGRRHEFGLAHIEACCQALRLSVQEGDMILARFGHGPTHHDSPTPGFAPEAALWLHEIGASVLGSDGPSDAFPAREGRWRVPIHQLTIQVMGMPLLDNCALEELAHLASEHGRYEFLLTAPALPLRGATGSPLNPLAIF